MEHNLMQEFSDRLIASGYNPHSVMIAVYKHWKYMHMQRINNFPNLNVTTTASCQLCPIHKEGRIQQVHGVGNINSSIMYIGESPGEHENMWGIPFIGISGTVLTMVLEKMPINRDYAYLTNVIKCRPKENRKPETSECATCVMKHLVEEILTVNPRIIVTIGSLAYNTLFHANAKITEIRGKWQDLQIKGSYYKVMPTIHPAYILRQTGDKWLQLNTDFYNDILEATIVATERAL